LGLVFKSAENCVLLCQPLQNAFTVAATATTAHLHFESFPRNTSIFSAFYPASFSVKLNKKRELQIF
jgi:hypothetical protein